MSNTEDSKSPIKTLQEAAEALKREAEPLDLSDREISTRRIILATTLQETADGLKRLAKGLKWIGLRWVPEPLKRTAVALMKLTPADIAEGAEALSKAAAALRAAAGAMDDRLLDDKLKGSQKLEEVRRSLGNHSALETTEGSLVKTAEAVGNASSADQEAAIDGLRIASSRLLEMAYAIEKAKAKENKAAQDS